MVDVLSLGGIVFQVGDYSPPAEMPFGGEQKLIVHKLPGGNRVIDVLGPDEDDIQWKGFFFSNDAINIAGNFDAMRAAGQVVPLIFAGMYRSVVIKHFRPKIRRYPVWVDYDICCVVSQNPAWGNLSAPTSTVDSLTQADLRQAGAIVGVTFG